MFRGVIASAMIMAPCLSNAATLRVDVTGQLQSAHLSGAFEGSTAQFVDLTVSRDENSQYYDALNDGGAAGFTVDTDHPTGYTFFSECYGFLSGMCDGDLLLSRFDESGDASAGDHASYWSRLDINLLAPTGVGHFNIASDPYLMAAAMPLNTNRTFDFDGVIYDRSSGGTVGRDFDGALHFLGAMTHSRLEYSLSSYAVEVVPLPAALGSLLFALAGFGVIRARQRAGVAA